MVCVLHECSRLLAAAEQKSQERKEQYSHAVSYRTRGNYPNSPFLENLGRIPVSNTVKFVTTNTVKFQTS
jgi:hypothetical protein